MAVCPEETANRVLQRSLSIPITMRAVINKGKGKIKQQPPDEADVSVGSHMNGLGHGLDSMDTKSMSNISSNRYKMEGGGRNTVTGGMGGTPACVKQEVGMEVDTDNTETQMESLNRDGPQGPVMEYRTGALTTSTNSSQDPAFRHPSAAVSRQSAENRRKSDSKSEMENSFSLTRGPLSDNQNKPKKDSLKPSKEGGGRSVLPNVSITPIPISNQCGTVEDSISRMIPTTGIEIIPLGHGKTISSSPGASGVLKAKSRDLKRSFSEDDKRRVPKKEKKRRDEKIRQSLNQEPGKLYKSDKYEGGSTSWTSAETESRANLAGVIERLSQKNKDNQSSIEIKPASSVSSEKVSTAPNLEITLNQVKKEDLSPKPKLKLNIKIPSKHFDHRNDTDGSYPKMTTASPKLESSTFQIPKLNKLDSPNFKKDRPNYSSKSPSTSPKHSFTKSPHSKINERFITDPSSVSSKRPEV